MSKNTTPNKIVKLVFEQVGETEDSEILKVYLEATERPLDDDMANSDDFTLAELYSSEVMSLVTAMMTRLAEENSNLKVHEIPKTGDMN